MFNDLIIKKLNIVRTVWEVLNKILKNNSFGDYFLKFFQYDFIILDFKCKKNMPKHLLFLFIVFSLIACNHSENTVNDFYKNTRKGDLFRIPLIEPYELLSTGKLGHGWFLQLPENTIPFEKQLFVDSIVVVNNIILTKTKEVDIINIGNTSIWCVIDSNFNVFYKETDVQKSLKKRGLNIKAFQNPDDLFNTLNHLKSKF